MACDNNIQNPGVAAMLQNLVTLHVSVEINLLRDCLEGYRFY